MYDEGAPMKERQAAMREALENADMTHYGVTEYHLLEKEEMSSERRTSLLAYVKDGDPDDLVVQKCVWELFGSQSVCPCLGRRISKVQGRP